MGQLVSQTWRNWHDGVITAVNTDEVPPTASPRGRNSALTRVGPGRALPAIRHGCTTVNETPISGSPVVHGQIEFKAYSTVTGAYTTYHLLVSDGGRLDYKDSSATTAVFDSTAATPFSSGSYRPDAAVASNAAYICNGQASNNKKAYINGGNRRVHNWGIDRPTVGTMSGAAGAAGTPNGTYELRVSFGNSVTGHESSNSDTASATVTVTNDRIDVSNIPVSADAQVDQRFIHVRNTATMTQFYRAATIANNTDTTATLEFDDADLITLAPDTAENDPPPTLHTCEWHNSRMFGAGPDDPTKLVYSKLGKPEAFDPDAYELVNPIDGQSIVATHASHGVLVVFKTNSVWLLIGDDPASWELRVLSNETGCSSKQGIVTVRGRTYWWSEQGMASWDGVSARIELAAQELLQPSVDDEALNFTYLGNVVAAVDISNRRVMFAVPGTGETRNTLIIPYSFILERFEAEYWDPLDIASIATIDDGLGNPTVYIGGYTGQIFKWWDGFNDGVPSGTVTGTVTSATSTTLVDSTAAFVTTGGSLIGRYAYAIDSTSRVVQRRRITANTATELTITPAWTYTPNTTYTYVVGGINFSWDTNAEDFTAPFASKRLRKIFIQVSVDNNDTTIYVDLIRDQAATVSTTRSFTVDSGGAIYGVSIYGVDRYGGGRAQSVQSWLSTMANAGTLRVRVLHANKSMILYKLGLTGELLDDNLGSGDGGTVIS